MYVCLFTTGLGCAFLTEPCTNQSVFPYLCDPSATQLLCTYDHLSKVCCRCMKYIIINGVIYVYCYDRVIVLPDGQVLMVALLHLPMNLNFIVELQIMYM